MPRNKSLFASFSSEKEDAFFEGSISDRPDSILRCIFNGGEQYASVSWRIDEICGWNV